MLLLVFGSFCCPEPKEATTFDDTVIARHWRSANNPGMNCLGRVPDQRLAEAA